MNFDNDNGKIIYDEANRVVNIYNVGDYTVDANSPTIPGQAHSVLDSTGCNQPAGGSLTLAYGRQVSKITLPFSTPVAMPLKFSQ
jgi:hypothetical protein